MFDITSTKLLILAIVALIVVGPKDLPVLLRTVGKYLGVVRRHAAEFRAQFDEAMREAELAELKQEFENVGREMRSTIEEGAGTLTQEVEGARRDVTGALEDSGSKRPSQAPSGVPEMEPKKSPTPPGDEGRKQRPGEKSPGVPEMEPAARPLPGSGDEAQKEKSGARS